VKIEICKFWAKFEDFAPFHKISVYFSLFLRKSSGHERKTIRLIPDSQPSIHTGRILAKLLVLVCHLFR